VTDRMDRMIEMFESPPERDALRDVFEGFFAKECGPERVRAAEPLGFDERLWTQLAELGVPAMAAGGDAAASLADLAVVARLAGAHLAPVPVAEVFAAMRLLDQWDACTDDLLTGEHIVTIAPRPPRGGVARLVPAGAIADAVLVVDGDELVLVQLTRAVLSPRNLAASPIGDCVLDGERVVLAGGAAARAFLQEAVDEWRLLSAAMLVGLAGAVLDRAVDYAKSRHQFGVPIGSFQALQHDLADVATAVKGAGLLVDASAVDEERRGVLAPMAAWFAGCVARDAASTSLHVHGGYGFMAEQDVQLFFRRAAGWALALGDPEEQLDVVAGRLAMHGWIDDSVPTGFRREVRAFLAEHCTAEVIARAHETGTMHDWSLHRALGARGWLAPELPVEAGGQGRDPWDVHVMNEELARAGAPIDGRGVSILVAHVLSSAGTQQQRDEIVPQILAGEVLCCLGYSEPDSGSDVAAARLRAVRDGNEWVINGQKMFTTLAHEAKYVFLLTRTNPDVAKRRGLTMFLVPMVTPGIEITPIRTIDGERTNVTFYTDVRVTDDCRVGEVDGGWDVMTFALAFERSPTMVGQLDRLVRRFVEWARGQGGVLERASVWRRLSRVIVDVEVGRLLGMQMIAVVARGDLPTVEGSMAKLYSSEAQTRGASDLVDALGIEGVLQPGMDGAPADGWIEHAYRHAQVETIRAGTSEIQRSIIAERGLGLPRSRA
jgi:alkylation response protein AidB-like acyl-CoA dehydrogenase